MVYLEYIGLVFCNNFKLIRGTLIFSTVEFYNHLVVIKIDLASWLLHVFRVKVFKDPSRSESDHSIVIKDDPFLF